MASISLYTDTQIKFLRDIITLLDKRKRNLEKRKHKLDEYKIKENLNEDQKLALSKADEVCASVELIDELSKVIGKIVEDAMKEAEDFVKNIQTILKDNKLSLLTKSLEMLEILNVLDVYTSDNQIQDDELRDYYTLFKRYLCRSSNNSVKCIKILSQNLLNINENNFDKLLPINPKVCQDMKPNRIKELVENIDSIDSQNKLRKVKDLHRVETSENQSNSNQQHKQQIQKSKEEKSFNFLHNSVVPDDQLQTKQRINRINPKQTCGDDNDLNSDNPGRKKMPTSKFPIPLMELSPTTTLSVENSQVLAECTSENKERIDPVGDTWNSQKNFRNGATIKKNLNGHKQNGSMKDAKKMDLLNENVGSLCESLSNFTCDSINGFSDLTNGNEPSKLFDLLMKFNNGSNNLNHKSNNSQNGNWQNGQSKLTPGNNVVGMKLINGDKKSSSMGKPSSMNINQTTTSNNNTAVKNFHLNNENGDQSSDKDLHSLSLQNNNQYHLPLNNNNGYFHHSQAPAASLIEVPPISWHSSNPIRPPVTTPVGQNQMLFNNNHSLNNGNNNISIDSQNNNLSSMPIPTSNKGTSGYPPNLFSSLHENLAKPKMYQHPFQSFNGNLNKTNSTKLMSNTSNNSSLAQSLTLDDLMNPVSSKSNNTTIIPSTPASSHQNQNASSITPTSNHQSNINSNGGTTNVSSAFLNNLSLKQKTMHRLASNTTTNSTTTNNNTSTVNSSSNMQTKSNSASNNSTNPDSSKKMSEASGLKDLYSSYNKYLIEKNVYSMDPSQTMDELEKMNIANSINQNLYDVN